MARKDCKEGGVLHRPVRSVVAVLEQDALGEEAADLVLQVAGQQRAVRLVEDLVVVAGA